MMKKIVMKVIAMLLVLTCLVNLTGCGNPSNPKEDEIPLQSTPIEDVENSQSPDDSEVTPTDKTDENVGTEVSPEPTTDSNPENSQEPEVTPSPEVSQQPEVTQTPNANDKEPTPSVEPTKDPVVEVNLTLSRNTLSLETGKVGNLTATYNGSKTLTWKSSNTSVATVSNGKVTAKAAGTATITVTDGTKSAQCTVTVTKPEVTDYTLSISRNSLSLEVGKVGNLTATYTGTGTLTWSSNNTSVATVSNGKVTAKAAGTAVITVSDGVKNSQCVVTVVQAEVKDYTLKLSKASLSLEVGNTESLTATYTGSKTLIWNSSNTAVATVNNGTVVAKTAGTSVITVSDGTKSAQCVITVTNPKPAPEVTLTLSKSSLSLEVGNNSTLTATYTGAGTLSWSSSNTSVATVSSGKITAKAAGTTTITVTDGTKTATCNVTVTATPAVTLNITPMHPTTLFIGETLQIECEYSGNKSDLTWTSKDTAIATVDQNGKVTAVSVGSTRITVTDGNKRAILTIVVAEPKEKATSIECRNIDAPLYNGAVKYAGDYMTFWATVAPYTSNQTIQVTSSNSMVVAASVHQNPYANVVTLNFKSAGSATVTLTSGDGAVNVSYTFHVKSGYDFNPGSGQLSPEQWAYYCTQVMVANGFTEDNTLGSWRLLTLKPEQLYFNTAVGVGQDLVHTWWINGDKYCQIVYIGQNEDGNYQFHTCWG